MAIAASLDNRFDQGLNRFCSRLSFAPYVIFEFELLGVWLIMPWSIGSPIASIFGVFRAAPVQWGFVAQYSDWIFQPRSPRTTTVAQPIKPGTYLSIVKWVYKISRQFVQYEAISPTKWLGSPGCNGQAGEVPDGLTVQGVRSIGGELTGEAS